MTDQQQEQMARHQEEDAANAIEQTLTAEQDEQMQRDLALLLPNGFPDEKTAASAPGRLKPVEALPEIEVEKFEPVTADVLHPFAAKTAWRAFPKGGWVYHDKPSWMQRVDQGQDFEIPWGMHIVASGWGHCIGWLHDRPFPNGFGSPYMVVYIGGGRFAGRLWYLGHMNYVQIRPGESFHAGRSLGRLYNSLNAGRGWIELGHAANGYPMSMGEGWKWHSLFTTPEYRWST